MCAICLYEHQQQQQQENNNNINYTNNIVVINSTNDEISAAQSFRSTLKSRQQQIAKTLSHLEVMQDTFPDRVSRLRETIDESFAEIRRLVDLFEADVVAALDLTARGNLEDLSTSADEFRRFEEDCEAYLRDADDALSTAGRGDPTRALGLVQVANVSSNGADLDLGNAEQISKNHDLPEFLFDRNEIISALRSACKLVSSQDHQQVDLIGGISRNRFEGF